MATRLDNFKKRLFRNALVSREGRMLVGADITFSAVFEKPKCEDAIDTLETLAEDADLRIRAYCRPPVYPLSDSDITSTDLSMERVRNIVEYLHEMNETELRVSTSVKPDYPVEIIGRKTGIIFTLAPRINTEDNAETYAARHNKEVKKKRGGKAK